MYFFCNLQLSDYQRNGMNIIPQFELPYTSKTKKTLIKIRQPNWIILMRTWVYSVHIFPRVILSRTSFLQLKSSANRQRFGCRKGHFPIKISTVSNKNQIHYLPVGRCHIQRITHPHKYGSRSLFSSNNGDNWILLIYIPLRGHSRI